MQHKAFWKEKTTFRKCVCCKQTSAVSSKEACKIHHRYFCVI
ncbi:hypothetical protein M7I_5196 [Glarea lozoyensis 74030]|uniref:Uncharacterized protein n=1 Tax=Glarea lozoyensis (strain ATCC 74030 / MF5533) TaxID=1104152 RepID=H0ER78_GLAL7|nr:hypothetical protein M7I_5196 [Glarea lozoyensis 74030]